MKILAIALLLACGLARGDEQLAAVTTTFEVTGGMSTMQAASPYTAVADRYTVHSDAVIRAFGHDVFVVNRFQSDNVLALDASNSYAVHTQFSVGALSNPQDILMVGATRAYVTRYESTKLWIVQPFSGSKLGEIDLAAASDTDGLPEMAQMAKVGERAFVTLQRLDRNAFFSPTGNSALLVIDTTSDSVVGEIALTLQNPDWRLRYAPSVQRLVSVAAGSFAVLDGGVELVDPYALASDGVVLSETSLGGDVLDAVIVTPTLGWVLHADASFNTLLRRFDPSDGSVDAPSFSTAGFYLTDLEVSDEGKLFVGDRTPADPGVRVFDAFGGAALAGPVSLGLPPFDLELVRTTPVATPAAASGAFLRAFPQPASSTVYLELGDPLPGERTLRIVDLRGRLVRNLLPESTGMTLRYRWDGLDDAGRTVASGRYFALGAGRRQPISLLR